MKTSTKVILSVSQIVLMFVTLVLLTYNPLDIETSVLIPSLFSIMVTTLIALVKIMDDLGPKEACA